MTLSQLVNKQATFVVRHLPQNLLAVRNTANLLEGFARKFFKFGDSKEECMIYFTFKAMQNAKCPCEMV